MTWISGVCADPVRNLVGQTESIMAGLDQSLKAAGLSFADVVKLTAHYVGGASADELHGKMKVTHGYYASPGPASTGIPVHALLNPDCRIAIDIVAKASGGTILGEVTHAGKTDRGVDRSRSPGQLSGQFLPQGFRKGSAKSCPYPIAPRLRGCNAVITTNHQGTCVLPSIDHFLSQCADAYPMNPRFLVALYLCIVLLPLGLSYFGGRPPRSFGTNWHPVPACSPSQSCCSSSCCPGVFGRYPRVSAWT